MITLIKPHIANVSMSDSMQCTTGKPFNMTDNHTSINMPVTNRIALAVKSTAVNSTVCKYSVLVFVREVY